MNRYRFFWESLGRMARACSGMQSIAFPTNRTMTKLNQMLHRQLGGLFVVQNNSIDAIESGPSVSSTRGTPACRMARQSAWSAPAGQLINPLTCHSNKSESASASRAGSSLALQ